METQGRKERDKQGCAYLATAYHRLYIGKAGVTIINTDNLDPEDADPRGDLLLLSPVEAVQMAHEILAQVNEPEAREAELEAQYEPICKAVLRMFFEQWRERSGSWFHPMELEKRLSDAYNTLLAHQSGQVKQWHESTYTDKFSYEQHQALFWRYFNRKYRDDLIEKCFPEINEANEE